MNKGELVTLIADHEKISKADAERALNWVTAGILHALHKGNNISLVGFGSFNIQHRKARDGHNPKTGQKMRIHAYNQPVFKAGKKMKDCCNKK
jgi:DNA-binding protein HU-beta